MKILKALLVFVVIFAFAEIASRIIMPSSVTIINNKTNKRLWMSDILISSREGKKFKPDLDLTIYNAWISHWSKLTYRTNSLGLRGSEVIINNPDTDYRILVLGDSITWGGYLPEEKTYVFQLGNMLRYKLHSSILTINAGIGDVGTIEEVRFLKEIYDKVKPKMVILGFYLNDSRPPAGFDSEKNLSWAKILQKSRFIDFLYNNVRLQAYLMRSGVLGKGYRYRWFYLYRNPRWKSDREYFAKMVRDANLDWGAAWDECSWPGIDKSIKELKDFADSYRVKLIIICFPVSFQVYADFLDDYPQKKIEAIAREYNIPFLDVLAQFRNNNKVDLFYDHCHLNVEGRYLVAGELAKFILDNKFIQK